MLDGVCSSFILTILDVFDVSNTEVLLSKGMCMLNFYSDVLNALHQNVSLRYVFILFCYFVLLIYHFPYASYYRILYQKI